MTFQREEGKIKKMRIDRDGTGCGSGNEVARKATMNYRETGDKDKRGERRKNIKKATR